MENDSFAKRRKWLILGGVAALILILAVSLGFLIHGRIFSAKVSVMVAPYTATVKIGDKTYGAFGEFILQPGEYAVEVSADGFATKTGRLVAKADETAQVNLYLEPDSEATANWYEENANDALIMGEIQNAEMMKKVAALVEEEPVLKRLPLTVEFYADDLSEHTKYTISYAVSDEEERGFYLIVKDYTGAGMVPALEKLTEMGMDTIGLRLEYENLEGDNLGAKAEDF